MFTGNVVPKFLMTRSTSSMCYAFLILGRLLINKTLKSFVQSWEVTSCSFSVISSKIVMMWDQMQNKWMFCRCCEFRAERFVQTVNSMEIWLKWFVLDSKNSVLVVYEGLFFFNYFPSWITGCYKMCLLSFRNFKLYFYLLLTNALKLNRYVIVNEYLKNSNFKIRILAHISVTVRSQIRTVIPAVWIIEQQILWNLIL